MAVILSNTGFENHLERRYKMPLEAFSSDATDVHTPLFSDVSNYVNVDVYVKLLASLEPSVINNFARFFTMSLRKHMGVIHETRDLEFVKESMELQVLLMLCLQYYFS